MMFGLHPPPPPPPDPTPAPASPAVDNSGVACGACRRDGYILAMVRTYNIVEFSGSLKGMCETHLEQLSAAVGAPAWKAK